jgi:hypothetical protein
MQGYAEGRFVMIGANSVDLGEKMRKIGRKCHQMRS